MRFLFANFSSESFGIRSLQKNTIQPSLILRDHDSYNVAHSIPTEPPFDSLFEGHSTFGEFPRENSAHLFNFSD